MPEMTLEEAVRVMRRNIDECGPASDDVMTVLTHAERTVAARSGDGLDVLRGAVESDWYHRQFRPLVAHIDHLTARLAEVERERDEAIPFQWVVGAPPHPWDDEWFLARTIHDDLVVLRPLPQEFTYDFTTADSTYFMRASIKQWAQLPESEYVAYVADLRADRDALAAIVERVNVLLRVLQSNHAEAAKMCVDTGYTRGCADTRDLMIATLLAALTPTQEGA
jgi:hypothetical protein